MCNLTDFDRLVLDESHRQMLANELDAWHEWYLPVEGTVLDIGAGNGETAQFYLNHGAKHVICIEPNADLLYRNFGQDPRVTIIPVKVDTIKSDCEGGERNMVVETHFWLKLRHGRPWVHTRKDKEYRAQLWKFEPRQRRFYETGFNWRFWLGRQRQKLTGKA